jgi:hypothetical protein
MDAELFNQPENTNPTMTKRISFGASGVITENMTLTNFVIWIISKLTNAWIIPVLTDATYTMLPGNPLRYRKNMFGQLEIKGGFTSTMAGSRIATNLPAGYRPPTTISLTYSKSIAHDSCLINTGGDLYVSGSQNDWDTGNDNQFNLIINL